MSQSVLILKLFLNSWKKNTILIPNVLSSSLVYHSRKKKSFPMQKSDMLCDLLFVSYPIDIHSFTLCSDTIDTQALFKSLKMIYNLINLHIRYISMNL